MAEYENYLLDSPSSPKWAEKNIQAVGELEGNLLEPRKTKSQFHNGYYASEIDLDEYCYMIIVSDPYQYQEYFHDPRWKSSMQDEFNSLQENETWELVPLPPKRKLVQCNWVFQTKIAADGSDVKYKTILVSNVFSQVQGVDYTETFAPVSKMDSIMLVLAIVASKCWEVHHMDVKSAFLHGEIQEDIYMQHH